MWAQSRQWFDVSRAPSQNETELLSGTKHLLTSVHSEASFIPVPAVWVLQTKFS
jgi:hypothetical protein